MRTVHLVVGESGEGLDAKSWPVAAYHSGNEARKHVRRCSKRAAMLYDKSIGREPNVRLVRRGGRDVDVDRKADKKLDPMLRQPHDTTPRYVTKVVPLFSRAPGK